MIQSVTNDIQTLNSLPPILGSRIVSLHIPLGCVCVCGGGGGGGGTTTHTKKSKGHYFNQNEFKILNNIIFHLHFAQKPLQSDILYFSKIVPENTFAGNGGGYTKYESEHELTYYGVWSSSGNYVVDRMLKSNYQLTLILQPPNV